MQSDSQTVFEWEKRRTGTLCLRTPKARPRMRRGSSAEAVKSFNAARSLGSAVSSPSGPWRSPAAKRHIWCIFWSENALSGKALKGYCKCLLINNCQQIVPSYFRVRQIRQLFVPNFLQRITNWLKVKRRHINVCLVKFYQESGRLKRTGTAFQCVPVPFEHCSQNLKQLTNLCSYRISGVIIIFILLKVVTTTKDNTMAIKTQSSSAT